MSTIHQFRNDYSEGAAPEMLEALVRTNGEQTPGYGTDARCEKAVVLIRRAIQQPDAFVQFIPGGTAANIVAISALTDEFEGPILAADPFGILTPEECERVYTASVAGGCHTTRPGMIYFSNTSEFGHVYTRAEFDALCDWAEGHELAVYVDGARMASALASEGCDLTMDHIAARADAFTLGGTKAGMLFGEALVVSPRTARGRRAIERIPYLTKRAGHMTAKGRLMGVQYEAAFTPGEDGALPYLRYAANANACAVKLAEGLVEAGLEPYAVTPGNQQFFWATRPVADAISGACGAEISYVQGRPVLRFVTSWATTAADVDELIAFVRTL